MAAEWRESALQGSAEQVGQTVVRHEKPEALRGQARPVFPVKQAAAPTARPMKTRSTAECPAVSWSEPAEPLASSSATKTDVVREAPEQVPARLARETEDRAPNAWVPAIPVPARARASPQKATPLLLEEANPSS